MNAKNANAMTGQKGIEDIDYIHLGDEFQMRSQLITQINRAHKKFLNGK